MGTTVDSLEIQLQMQATKANNSIDTLITKLGRLNTSLTTVNSRGFATMGAGINKLANATSNFSKNTKSTDFSRLSRNIKTLNNIDTSQIASLSGSLKTLASGLAAISEVKVNAEGLNGVASVLRSLGGIKSTSGTENLSKIKNDLVQFVNGMNSVGAVTFNPESLSVLINSISKLGRTSANNATKNLPTISAQLQNFVRQLNKIGALNFDTKNLSDIITAISRLGYKSSGKAVENIPKLATAMNGLMASLSKAPKVSQNLIDMTNALAKLARTGASSGKAATSLSRSLDTYTRSTSKASSGTKGLASAIGKLYATYWVLFRAFGKIGDAINLSSDLTEVQNVVDATFGDYTDKIEKLSDVSITNYGMSELTAKTIASRFQAMGVAAGFSQGQMADMSVELTKLTADMASFYNMSQEDVARSLWSVFTGETEPMRKYGLDLTYATLQEWALKQGIDANIYSMSQMEKVLLRYQYVMANTEVVQGDFVRTMNTWANQVRILQEQFKAFGTVIGTGLIAAFKPFLQNLNIVMAKVINFTETVLNALGTIFGWKFEVSTGGGATNDLADSMADTAIDTGDAAGSAGDLSDNLGQAAKNAKKLHSVVLGIDELNINAPDTGTSTPSGSGSGGSGGSGGGSGSGAGASGSGLTTAMTRNDAILEAYESSIDSLYKLGRYISDTLADVLEGINWDSVYKKARGFGKGLAQFLNGLITPRLFYDLGETVANSINTAFHAINAFSIEFDWDNLGESLASSVTGFFENWDAGLTGETFSNFVDGIIEAITSFVETLDADDTFKTIGQKLVDLFWSIDWAGLVWDVSKLVDAIWALPEDFGEGVLEALIEKIFGKKVDIEVPNIISDLLKFPNPFTSITEKFKLGKEFLPSVLISGSLDDVTKKIKNWIDTQIAPLFSKEKWAKFGKNIWSGITQKISGLAKWFDEKWVAIKTVFLNAPSYFREKFESAYEKVRNAFQPISSWFHEKYDSVKGVFRDVREFFKSKFESAYKSVTDVFKSITSWFHEKWDAVKGVFKDVKTFFKKAFKGAYDAITGVFDNIGTFFKKVASKFADPIESAINKIIDGIKWILKKLGADSAAKKFSHVDFDKFASGSNGIPNDTIGVVNDQSGNTYKEMIVPPKGKPFIPEGRNVVLPLEKGTKIMPANQTKALINGMPHFAGGIGDFFAGDWESVRSFTGDIWDYVSNPKKIVQIALDKFVDISGVLEPWYSIAGGVENKTFDAIVDYIKGIFDTSAPKVNYNPSAGVEQWRALAKKALQMTNQYSESNLNLLLYQMQTESGGNPKAINNWDINAKRGTPSKGLMQVIDPTFKAYAMKGYNKNIWDPLSNMLAAIRYTLSRYGSLANGWKGHGYANGIGKINWSDLIPQYEVGGFPEDGLFMANHNELVGQFSNGKTAVASNNQIVEGIKQGVKEAVSEILAPYLKDIADNTRETADKDLTVNIGDRTIVEANKRGQARMGYSFTG